MGARPRRGAVSRRPLWMALVALALAARAVRAEPSDGELALVGLALTPPTYFLGVALHEGSHALAAKALGAEVLSVRLLPGRDPRTRAFHFGLTRVRGLDGDGERLAFFLAPKATDTLLLGGFIALVATDAWPRSRYGQLTLTVLATGVWVDFTKDVLSFSPHNDVVKAMTLAGLDTEWRRLPVRLAYAALAGVAGYYVARGYRRTFEGPTPAAARVAPLWSAAW